MNADDLAALAGAVLQRFVELVMAPLSNQEMLWSAIPLAIATLFMTLYFGRNKREELGWNTAFGNTMVFLFVAIGLIREMYRQGGSLASLFDNTLYFMLTVGLAGASVLLMSITYFHLLPKRLAFFVFSAPPINVSVYVVMAIVYANVVPDYLTVLAAMFFILVIVVAAKLIQFLIRLVGLGYEEEEKVDREDMRRIAEKVEKEINHDKVPKPKGAKAAPDEPADDKGE